jgi:hypothetical protein
MTVRVDNSALYADGLHSTDQPLEVQAKISGLWISLGETASIEVDKKTAQTLRDFLNEWFPD